MGASLSAPQDANFFMREVASGSSWPCAASVSEAAFFAAADWPSSSPELAVLRARTSLGRAPRGTTSNVWLGCALRSVYDGMLPSRRQAGLNISAVVDCSSSMQLGMRDPTTEAEVLAMASKFSVCKSFVVRLREALSLEEDRLTVAYFSEGDRVGTVDLDKVAEWELVGGGTKLVLGMKEAAANARRMKEENPEAAETRIVFLTDMVDTSEDSDGPKEVLQLSEELSREGIHVTFIGVGVDFDGESTRSMGAVPGANWFCCSEEAHLDRIVSDVGSAFLPVAKSVHLDVIGPNFRIVRCAGMDRGGVVGQATWTPTLHASYPKSTRIELQSLVTACRVALGVRLPNDVVGVIASHLCPASRFTASGFSHFFVANCFRFGLRFVRAGTRRRGKSQERRRR